MNLTYLHFPVVTSTNTLAKEMLLQQAPEGTVIWASQQTHGRGRLGRQWVSELGNIFTSIIIKPAVPLSCVTQLSFVAAISVHEVLETYILNKTITLKWPNDVLIDGKKICGILIETEILEDNLIGVVIGIGMNRTSFPEKTSYPSTCLSSEMTGALPESEELIKSLWETFSRNYDVWLRNGFTTILLTWNSLADSFGKLITLSTGESGIFRGINEQGSLLLETTDHTIKLFHSAEIKSSCHINI
jgi:BirA family biotin operon repressor/biotin-[acetyl-CoA-carboxylase] ligase